MSEIIEVVHISYMTRAADLTSVREFRKQNSAVDTCKQSFQLHEFIRLYPSIAAENYDEIVMTLEKKCILEFERTNELKETIKEMLENIPVEMEDNASTTFPEIERERFDSSLRLI